MLKCDLIFALIEYTVSVNSTLSEVPYSMIFSRDRNLTKLVSEMSK